MATTNFTTFNLHNFRTTTSEAFTQAKEYLRRNLPRDFADIMDQPKVFFDAHRDTIISIGGTALSTTFLCYFVGMKAFSTFATALIVAPVLMAERSLLPETKISHLCCKILALAAASSVLGVLSGPVPFALSLYTAYRVFEHVEVINTTCGTTQLRIPVTNDNV